ncbi:MAG: transporter [Dongiaceae bacterium]
MSESDIARELQNPVADLISVPFQNNVNTGFGPERGTLNVLNIQPVVPFDLNDDWNLITRVILPVTWQPRLVPGGDSAFGLGNTLASLFLSPSRPMGGFIWGIGPAISIPTATETRLGSNIWGAGPSAVALRMDGPWVYGALISNVWSFGGQSGPGGNKYNVFTLQPFVNYNFGGGWYATTSPIINANWLAEDDQRWTVPIGAGFGKVIRLFNTLPVNLQVAAYYNVVRPDHIGPVWQIRSSVTFVLPSF